MTSSSIDPSSRDASTSVQALRDLVEQFVAERHWHSFHNPKNLAMSLGIETGELMEHFQWLTLEEAADVQHDAAKKHDVGEELADCLAYVLAIANAMQIDLSSTLAKKMIRNAEKYPPP
ncbi:MazG nucleotide pyrophosphohydrolase domain protein [Stieleria neptunia]|uniref:MazG nucleotide pyrophosphohydrolase domain protein n=1 Tax=Stieleria neptunia TaxID=2527979 RepID=A0A518HM28_9BACT|nr:nucleotide pyrophosphohydrolase [Stieleria neptunia]QDV41911.1 MazG nucleotide pyrophosphohydrolase domain protein [Stieleria neptunia]